jgi:hypothetical protein
MMAISNCSIGSGKSIFDFAVISGMTLIDVSCNASDGR